MKTEDYKYANFWERLGNYIVRSEMESMFDEPQKFIDKTQWAYDKARQLLGPVDEDALVLHVASCEEFCRTYAFAAYEMGREDALILCEAQKELRGLGDGDCTK